MNKDLRKSIDQFGGKHGVLLYIRQHLPEFKKYVLPLEVFAWDKSFSLLDRLRYTFKPDYCLLRTSHPYDWYGLIDAMPTVPTFVGDLVASKQHCYTECSSDLFRLFAERDGLRNYNINDVTLSLTEYKKCLRLITVTEHPNRDGIYYFDVVDLKGYEENHPRNSSFVFNEKAETCYQQHWLNAAGFPGLQNVAREILAVCRSLRDTNVFGNESALQFEFGLMGERFSSVGEFYLFQVRHFAPFQKVEKFVDPNREREFPLRVLGVTPPEGITLNVVSTHWLHISESYEQPFVYLRHKADGRLRVAITHQPPPTMRAYFPLGNPALTHNHSRFVQMALRQGGVAVLGAYFRESGFEDSPIATIYSDGLNVKVTVPAKKSRGTNKVTVIDI